MREPLNLLDQWIQLINIVDIDNLLNLYDSEAILIPTFSDRILNTPEKLREYFESLGTYQDLTVTVHEKTVAIQDLQKDIFLLGYYYSKIEKWILVNFKDELEIMDIADIVTLVCEEDFYKFYQYINEIKKLEHSIRGKYSF